MARKCATAQENCGFGAGKARSDAGAFETIPADTHMMVLGPAGVGKTTGTIMPRLLDYEGPAVVLDVKGELYERTARQRRKMGQEVLLLDPFGKANGQTVALNPLAQIASAPDPENRVWEVAQMMMPNMHGKDAFWETHAASLISGVLLYLVDREKRTGQEATLGAVHDILTDSDIAYTLSHILDETPGLPRLTRNKIEAVLQMPDVTRGGVFASTLPALHLFGLPAVRQATGAGGLPLQHLTSGAPRTLYFCMPPYALEPYGPLLRLWFDMILSALFLRDEIPELPMLLAIDEAAALGRMQQIETAFTLGRGYGVSLITVFQSIHQVRTRYGKASQTLFDNAGAIMAFPPTNMASAQDIATLLGGVSADQILGLNSRQALLATPGQPGRIVERYDVRFDPELARLADPNPRHPVPV